MLGGYGMYGYGYGYRLDPTIFLVLIGVLLSLWAQNRVNSTFARYSRVRNFSGMTGAEAARRLLNAQGIYDVTVQPVSGKLTDHYDPRTNVVKLSDSVYNATSVAAIGVAAHECGHAMQHNEGYGPLRFRSALVPVANFGSQLSHDPSGDLIRRSGFPAGPGGDPDVQLGSAVPAGDPSGGVQRLQPGGASFGLPGDLVRGGSGRHQKGLKGSGPYVRGGSGRLYFTASASCDPVWRKRP